MFHSQEIDEMMKQVFTDHVTVVSAFALPDLAAALKQIQTQYDDIASKNLQVKQHQLEITRHWIFKLN